MSLTAGQINSFHMVATCCLANLGSKLADMERICDPSYKCLEEKCEYVRMLLSEICGYVPDGVEVLPFVNYYSSDSHGGTDVGDTIQLFVGGIAIMNPYATTGNGIADIYGIAAAIESYGLGFGYIPNLSEGYITVLAPPGSGTTYSNAMVTATIIGTGNLVIDAKPLSYGVPTVTGNCISSDDVEAIMNKIQSELNICSSLAELPETTLLTSPCGCN